MASDHDRLYSRIDVRGEDECWPWVRGATYDDGRGKFWLDGRMIPAPAAMLALNGRPVREGWGALHTCDNPSCCNPRHLYEGTAQDNAWDMIARRRHASFR